MPKGSYYLGHILCLSQPISGPWALLLEELFGFGDDMGFSRMEESRIHQRRKDQHRLCLKWHSWPTLLGLLIGPKHEQHRRDFCLVRQKRLANLGHNWVFTRPNVEEVSQCFALGRWVWIEGHLGLCQFVWVWTRHQLSVPWGRTCCHVID